MIFKELKAGYPIFLFDRNEITVKQAKTIGVSAPHIETAPTGKADMVVDVTIDDGGSLKTYTFKDTTQTGYNGALVISTEKTEVLKEVEAVKTNADQLLGQTETLKANAKKAQAIIEELNPEIKERQRTESRLNRLEDNITSLKEMLEILVKQKNTDGTKRNNSQS